MRTDNPLITLLLVARTILKSVATRGRVAGLGVLGALAVLLGLASLARAQSGRSPTAWAVVSGYGISLLVPVVSLVFATAALGDLAEDGTLVYLWVRPQPRWRLVAGGLLAAMSLSLGLAVAPVVVAAALAGGGTGTVVGAGMAGILASFSYCAIFVGLGLWARRALMWGLVYLLIWEEAIARLSPQAAKVSILVSANSLLAHLAGHAPPRNAVSSLEGVVFMAAIGVAAFILSVRSLRVGEIR